MNIFEFLGLPADHRKESKITQLVKHFDEVIEKHKKGKTFGIQLKLDGCCSLTVVLPSGEVGIFSRTGKLFTNTHFAVARVKAMQLPPGVYMGELYVPKDIASLEEFSGCINPNRKKPLSIEMSFIPELTQLGLFDKVSLAEFVVGESGDSFYTRWALLAESIGEGIDGVHIVHYVLASPVQHHKIDECIKQEIEAGNEGIVICDMDAGWEAGHKGWRKMKLVRGVDYDLLCVGFEDGKGKAQHHIANLFFTWKDGVTIKASLGKGWDQAHSAAMFIAASGGSEEYGAVDPVGKIFQVYALEESSKGKLRLPKVGELRHDKGTSDV